ncbi:MAG: tetratricopeptide repeat protein [Hydrogenophaga sp.]
MTHPLRLPVSLRLLALAWAVSATLSISPAQAQADDHAEVNRLMRAGQMAEALSRVDQSLGTRPRDPQMRFLKGVIQAETGKTTEAIATFIKLTEDYPELPEPYNNLAVIYASQSQFDKARAALEMAIRTNPSYATAHENLGDVYAKLASQAYSKALQLNTGAGTSVQPKLSLIRSLFNSDGKATRTAAAPAPVPAAPAPATPSVQTPVSPAPTPVTTTPAPGPAAAVAVPATTTPAAQATASTTQDLKAATARSEVEAAVQAWAKAWSSKNVSAYLAAYAPNFTPPDGQSRPAWEADRRARIAPRKRISVVLQNLDVTVQDGRASARFRQIYSSDSLNVTSRKTLQMVKSGNRWLILRESSGS